MAMVAVSRGEEYVCTCAFHMNDQCFCYAALDEPQQMHRCMFNKLQNV
jgi:hypothetical protein